MKESKKPQTLSEDALRKRREREEKRAAAARAKALAEGTLEDTQDELFTPAATSTPVVDQRSATPATNVDLLESLYTVTIPASSPESLSWYSSKGAVYDNLQSAKEAGIWTYPGDLHERAKCGVFRDLLEKGYYMGGGIKFGGDFLVYPGTCFSCVISFALLKYIDDIGDPLRYHSHFVTTVIDSPLSVLRPMEIVAHGRLGTATKKAHLLCGWDDEKKEVSYLSIEWAGFG